MARGVAGKGEGVDKDGDDGRLGAGGMGSRGCGGMFKALK